MEKHKETLAIIQARMGSSRLPNKVMMEYNGKPFLHYLCERVKSSNVDYFVVATTTSKNDDVIEDFCSANGIGVFRGSEDDVLDRFYSVAKLFMPDVIIRIMADQVVLDPKVINLFIDTMQKNGYDFIGNKGFPEGQNIDIFTYDTLVKAWSQAKSSSDREHVCPYIYQNPDKFNIHYIVNNKDLTQERWVLDKYDDYKFLIKLYEGLYKSNELFGMKEITDYLKKNQHLKDINNSTKTKEGYIKSLNIDNGLYLNDQYKKQCDKIAMKANTMSKAYYYYPEGFTPIAVSFGKGANIVSSEGITFIDYVSGLGSNLLGYQNGNIDVAMYEGIEHGMNLSLPHYNELLLADRLVAILPGVDKIKLGKNGSDMTSAAVRAARIFTKKEHIAYCGYHGSQDWYCADTVRNYGVPKSLKKLIHQFKWNEIESLEKIFKETNNKIAAVIFEIPYDEPKRGFLNAIKKLAHDNGAVVIMDEVVTGMRWGLKGASGKYKIKPDMVVIGKALGNGASISVLGGREDIMNVFDNHGFFSFTFAGELTGVNAALAMLKFLETHKVHDVIKNRGDTLISKAKELIKANKINIEIKGNCFRFKFDIKDWDNKYNNKLRTVFMQEMLRQRILCRDTAWFVTYAHTNKDILTTLKALNNTFKVMRKCYDQKSTDGYLRTYEIQSPFLKR